MLKSKNSKGPKHMFPRNPKKILPDVGKVSVQLIPVVHHQLSKVIRNPRSPRRKWCGAKVVDAEVVASCY